MFAIFPLLCFIFSWLSFQKKQGTILGWRGSFLSAALIWGLLVVVSTEVLSLLHAISFAPILIFWIIAASIAAACFFLDSKSKPLIITWPNPKLSLFEILLLSCLGLIILIIGLIAFTAPPNTWDSMTYHMSRVMHWIQNHSIINYPTHILRQLWLGPYAEFSILHLHILSGSDRLANLVQWFSMVGSVCGVSFLAKQLNANRHGQILSSIVAATIPMGILQASSTQNDYVVTFWLICFTCFFFLFKKQTKWIYTLPMALSLGLALLTKGTAYIYAFPFMVWWFLANLKTCRRQIWKPLLTVFLCIFILNGGQYYRNFNLGGHIISPTNLSKNVSNKTFGIRPLAINVIRNAAMHCTTSFPRLNKTIEKTVLRLHDTLGIAPDDPRLTYGGKFLIPRLRTHEDHAGNPVHIMFILICIILFCLRYRRESSNLKKYFFSILGCFLLFCLYIKWQPWHSRLHLPMFILYAPFIGIVVSQTSKFQLANIITIFFLFSAKPYLLHNASRPLFSVHNTIFSISRTNQYFTNRPDLQQSYLNTSQYIQSIECSDIGIMIGTDSWEYPLWPLIKKNNTKNYRLEHIEVNNLSLKKTENYPLSNFLPCAIVKADGDNTKIQFDENTFIKTRKFHNMNIFLKDTSGRLVKENLIYHFNRSFKLTQMANELMKKNKNNGSLDKKNTLRLIHIRREELNEAKTVDTEELNNIYPNFGNLFKEHFVKGLELRLAGLGTSNPSKYKHGEMLIAKFNLWMNQNKVGIAQGFKTY